MVDGATLVSVWWSVEVVSPGQDDERGGCGDSGE